MRNVSPLLAFFLFGPQASGAADINVIALTAGKAVVVIDGGKPRTLMVGQTTPERIKLISATSEEAVFEVEGKRRTVTTGGSVYATGGGSGAQRTVLTSDAMGHFFTTAVVNGVSMQFLVDTGASMVTISSDDARRAGISYLSGQRGLMQTANGVVSAYRVKFDTVRLGDITLTNVDGLVVQGNALGRAGLLGMSFLNRTEMRRDGDTMTLMRRY
ncbi:MAG: TIGR02281 family clan AA aspartic protease [Betaproteobacteria bacterium]|nr:TIGR02281 family clan AA aspartic protease [Betaproteobacteria bacterium]